MDDFEKELKVGFLEEAAQSLESAEQAFLALESDPHNADLLNQIFRLAHNLKGTSRAVGFGDIAEFTHVFETLILRIKEQKIQPEPGVVNLLLACNDRVRHMVSALKENLEERFQNADLVEQLERVISGQKLGGPTAESTTATDPAPAMSVGAEDPFAVEPVPSATDEGFITAGGEPEVARLEPVAAFVSEPPPPAAPELPRAAREDGPTKAVVDETLRVSLGKLEDLNNLVGELVILQSVLAQHRSEIRSPLALKSLNQLAKLAKAIHEMSMSLRMVPIKSTLQKMQRIVRDTSAALQKKVLLELIGEETEVDKTILERLNDPLVHIVRNAIDHGLEATSDRLPAGKPESGRVTIRCFHEGNLLVIEVQDDGKGIDPKIIGRKAVEKGLVRDVSSLRDNEIINLIFHPGFSTKDQVSEISGRGVGMDVVKTNINALSGNVSIQSVVGKGTTFRITLPLTMAVIDGLVTQVGDEKYVLPLAQVQETLRAESQNIHQQAGVGEVLSLRGKVIPLYRLRATLKRPAPPASAAGLGTVIVTRSGSREYGVMVDEVHHQQQIVVKDLGPEISARRGFMGSSILGDGKPALIVDIHKLYEPAERKASA